MLLDELGGRIRKQREKLGLRQQDVAHALQVSPQAVSKWERGENGPDIMLLGPLAKLLGVSTDWLLDTYAEGRDVFNATVLASDVSGAYRKSLEMTARDFAAWANGLFAQVTEAALRHDGVPVKYMGDKFLCFFSGSGHQLRAARAALLAKRMVADPLVIGLSGGEIYLGSVGHPDYARPDIMGETVNIAFLTLEWAEEGARGRIGATASLTAALGEEFRLGKAVELTYKGAASPVKVRELKAARSD